MTADDDVMCAFGSPRNLAASVSVPTIKRLEAQDGPLGGRADTSDKIEVALEKAGVEFIDENGGGAGVRLKKPLKKRT